MGLLQVPSRNVRLATIAILHCAVIALFAATHSHDELNSSGKEEADQSPQRQALISFLDKSMLPTISPLLHDASPIPDSAIRLLLGCVHGSTVVTGLINDHGLVRPVLELLQPGESGSPQPLSGAGPRQDSEGVALLVSELVCSPLVDAIALCGDELNVKLASAIGAVVANGTTASREMLGALFLAADIVVRQAAASVAVDTAASADSLDDGMWASRDATSICSIFLPVRDAALRTASSHPEDDCADAALHFFESLVALFPAEYRAIADYESLAQLSTLLDSDKAPTMLLETALRILLRAVSASEDVSVAVKHHPSLSSTVDAFAGGAAGPDGKELASLANDVLEYLG